MFCYVEIHHSLNSNRRISNEEMSKDVIDDNKTDGNASIDAITTIHCAENKTSTTEKNRLVLVQKATTKTRPRKREKKLFH